MDSAIFIGAAIIALTQAIKYIVPGVSGAITIIVAILLGILVSLLGPTIGVAHITIAEGIITALAAVGVHTTATRVNTVSTVTTPKV